MDTIFNHIIISILLLGVIFVNITGCSTDHDTSHDPSVFVVAVGERGSIIHCDSTRCEKIESPIGSGLENSFSDVVVLSKECAFIVGKNGTILRWDGTAWKQEEVPLSENLIAIDAISPDFVYAVGEGGVILHFDGVSWSEVYSPFKDLHVDEGFALHDIDLLDRNSGITVGGPMTGERHGALGFFDGAMWTLDRFDQDCVYTSVGMASKEYAATGGYNDANSYAEEAPANLIEWNGDTWTRVEGLPWRRFVTGISFANQDMGFAVTDHDGGPVIAKYNNHSWTTIEHDITRALEDVHMISENLGFAVGTRESVHIDSDLVYDAAAYYYIIKWDGKTWSQMDTTNIDQVVTEDGVLIGATNLYGVSGVGY